VTVLLNVVLEIVFSEPMAPSTITPETVFLEALGARVQGSVLPSPDGLRAVFHPAADLRPSTEHLLVITTGATDQAGDPLEEEVVVEFTTIDTTLAIAFGRKRVTTDNHLGLWRMNSDGSGMTRVILGPFGCCWQAAWAPDGTQLAFVVGDGGTHIYRVNADGSGLRRLTNSPGNDWWPAWSPDGTKIAFGSERTGNHEVWVMNADGSHPVRLTTGGGDGPSWSPDGSRIVFNTPETCDIHIMNSDGSQRTPRLARGCGPRWSPDGNRILSYYGEGNPDIYLINVDGTGRVNLTNSSTMDWFAAWSPDGSQIVFTRSPVGAIDFDIWVMNANGTNQVRLTTGDGETLSAQPSWRP
jgi:Tol biopolymer transport system component